MFSRDRRQSSHLSRLYSSAVWKAKAMTMTTRIAETAAVSKTVFGIPERYGKETDVWAYD